MNFFKWLVTDPEAEQRADSYRIQNESDEEKRRREREAIDLLASLARDQGLASTMGQINTSSPGRINKPNPEIRFDFADGQGKLETAPAVPLREAPEGSFRGADSDEDGQGKGSVDWMKEMSSISGDPRKQYGYYAQKTAPFADVPAVKQHMSNLNELRSATEDEEALNERLQSSAELARYRAEAAARQKEEDRQLREEQAERDRRFREEQANADRKFREDQQRLGQQYALDRQNNANALKSVQATPDQSLQTATDVKDALERLLAHPGFSGEVGSRLISPAYRFGTLKEPISGTSAAGANALYNTAKSSLTMTNLGKLKGVLSDSDMKVLASAASALDNRTSEADFRTEAQKIIDKMNAVIERRGQPAGVDVSEGFTDEKKRRLEELRAKKAAGTLGR